MPELVIKNSAVTGRTSRGVEIRANLIRLTRQVVTFEVCDPIEVLHVSEVLSDFNILVSKGSIYSGRAVIRSIVQTGLVLMCEATLDDQWLDADVVSVGLRAKDLRDGFTDFLRSWQNMYKIGTEFKVVVADLQTFLTDLRLWLEQVEIGIRSSPSGDRVQMERDAMQELEKLVIPAINSLHERFEDVADRIDEDLRPVHQIFARRQLHPFFLCSPFGYRAFNKPLGYAGDYEMVNMIMKDPYEGTSLFAKTMNLWLLRQYPSEAHRNRIVYLRAKLNEEALRMRSRGRPVKILNLGCGPAHEIQQFLESSPVADHTEFLLIDFNEETLDHARSVLQEAQRKSGCRALVEYKKRSVMHLLKEGSKAVIGSDAGRHDFIYCAGLFDYLADRTCRQVLSLFNQWLAPGGLIVVTNVDACKPFRQMLEFILDWHLIYRNSRQLQMLIPDEVSAENSAVKIEATGTNVFLEIRKPDQH
jgi:extracellular factor (EF) 3-hydroxypalmitic acid methyl ester biosynthesis protein